MAHALSRGRSVPPTATSTILIVDGVASVGAVLAFASSRPKPVTIVACALVALAGVGLLAVNWSRPTGLLAALATASVALASGILADTVGVAPGAGPAGSHEPAGYVSQSPAPTGPSGTLVEPVPGARVPVSPVTVRGTSNLSSSAVIVVVTQCPDFRYYPNGGHAEVEPDGTWSVSTVTVGSGANPPGDMFNLIAYELTPTAEQSLARYFQEGKYIGLTEMPTGAQAFAIVTVKR